MTYPTLCCKKIRVSSKIKVGNRIYLELFHKLWSGLWTVSHRHVDRRQVSPTIDRRSSPVDHTQRPARYGRSIGRDSARRAGPSASVETHIVGRRRRFWSSSSRRPDTSHVTSFSEQWLWCVRTQPSLLPAAATFILQQARASESLNLQHLRSWLLRTYIKRILCFYEEKSRNLTYFIFACNVQNNYDCGMPSSVDIIRSHGLIFCLCHEPRRAIHRAWLVIMMWSVRYSRLKS